MNFELRGVNGVEEVKISVGDTPLDALTLPPDWMKFSYSLPYEQKVIINFHSDGSKDEGGDVILRNPELYHLKLVKQWNDWKWDASSCGLPSENQRCNELRQGKLYWEGVYELRVDDGK